MLYKSHRLHSLDKLHKLRPQHVPVSSRPLKMPSSPSSNTQSGFTLLEILVVMVIFAILMVSGWQVFNGITRSKDIAQVQAKKLSNLQYAYLQIQKDMAQVVPYYKVTPQSSKQPSEANSSQDNTNTAQSGSQNDAQGSNTTNEPATSDTSKNAEQNNATTAPQPLKNAKTTFELSNNRLSFIRFADPDPRYQTSKILERVAYVFDGNRLLRLRYPSLSSEDEGQIPFESVLLDNITAGQFQALMPEPVSQFPTEESDGDVSLMANNATDTAINTDSNDNTQNSPNVADAQSDQDENKPTALPKGVTIQFGYELDNQENPILWQFALNPSATTVQ